MEIEDGKSKDEDCRAVSEEERMSESGTKGLDQLIVSCTSQTARLMAGLSSHHLLVPVSEAR
jgi:hypothetical protein